MLHACRDAPEQRVQIKEATTDVLLVLPEHAEAVEEDKSVAKHILSIVGQVELKTCTAMEVGSHGVLKGPARGVAVVGQCQAMSSLASIRALALLVVQKNLEGALAQTGMEHLSACGLQGLALASNGCNMAQVCAGVAG